MASLRLAWKLGMAVIAPGRVGFRRRAEGPSVPVTFRPRFQSSPVIVRPVEIPSPVTRDVGRSPLAAAAAVYQRRLRLPRQWQQFLVLLPEKELGLVQLVEQLVQVLDLYHQICRLHLLRLRALLRLYLARPGMEPATLMRQPCHRLDFL